MTRIRALLPTVAGLALAGMATGFATSGPSGAQEVATPNFRDPRLSSTGAEPGGLTRLRFLTSTDYPPFNFLDAQGRLAGLNVDLARALCEELGILDICQIEARPFEELPAALAAGEGEAIIAGLAMTPESRRQFAFTGPYFRYPARFVVLRGADLAPALAEGLAGRRIAVVEGSAHDAMLRAFFPGAVPVPFANREAALAALTAAPESGAVEAMFGDGVALSFWLSSDTAADCCAFSGGPYLSDTFLGEGLAIAVRPENAVLAAAFDRALTRIAAERGFSELLLRSFPISAF